jgi:hypothetical protein
LGHPKFESLENSRPDGLLFSGELLETGGIHNSSYWKIAGLTACYFHRNSWKLGASIVWIIGKQPAYSLLFSVHLLETFMLKSRLSIQ